jgi:hypothetical protein
MQRRRTVPQLGALKDDDHNGGKACAECGHFDYELLLRRLPEVRCILMAFPHALGAEWQQTLTVLPQLKHLAQHGSRFVIKGM